MIARRDPFQAIADPTRRSIIGMIASKPLPIGAIAAKFEMSQQAISLHVRILSDCGLVRITSEGRNRICEARLEKLEEVSVWVDQYRRHWENRLDSLENYLEKIKKQKYGKRKK